jgi:thymidylate synthase
MGENKMYINAESLDDLLLRVYKKLLQSKLYIVSSKGRNAELPGVLLKISHPRTRLSRTESRSPLFTCLGELTWYLAGSNDLDFITYYLPRYKDSSDDTKTVYGAYGPRIRGEGEKNQVATIIELLKRKKESRQAVIQLFDSVDILKPHNDIPCTCSIQFLVRRERLDMFVNMRSNDAFMGLPHDIFAFTMLQEIIARSLGVEMGTYKHAVGSLHLYDENRDAAEKYISEGWQSKVPMPAMPFEDPWPAIQILLDSEKIIRNGGIVDFKSLTIDPYWIDLIRILQIFQFSNGENIKKVDGLIKKMKSDIYAPYLVRRRIKKTPKPSVPEQLHIFSEIKKESADASRP